MVMIPLAVSIIVVVAMRAKRRAQLVASLDSQLVDELLEAHEEAKRDFYLGGNRLAEVEGGRFCDAAFRLLQQIATLPSTLLSRTAPLSKNGHAA